LRSFQAKAASPDSCHHLSRGRKKERRDGGRKKKRGKEEGMKEGVGRKEGSIQARTPK